MRKRSLLILVIIVAAVWLVYVALLAPKGEAHVNYTPAEKSCINEETNGIEWHYCIYLAPQGTNGDVAIRLHGKGLDENSWNDDTYYTALIQKAWADKNVKPPIVVTVSFGKFWLLAPKNEHPKTGLMEIFVKDVLPKIEANTGHPKHRILFGESMGGLNSLILSLHHPELFSRVLALCPPIYKMSPFVRYSEMWDFLKRTGADPRTIVGVIQIGKTYASTQAEWNEIAPLTLLEKADPKTFPELYLSCGLYDKYGNFGAAEEFAETAKKRGFNIDWHPLYGGHCVVDINSVADFLAR